MDPWSLRRLCCPMGHLDLGWWWFYLSFFFSSVSQLSLEAMLHFSGFGNRLLLSIFVPSNLKKKSMANFITRMQNECLRYKYNSHDFKCHHKLERHTSSVKNYAPRAVSYAPWEDLYYSHHSWRLSFDDCNIFIVQATVLSFVTYWVKIDRYWPNSATLWECAKNNRA